MFKNNVEKQPSTNKGKLGIICNLMEHETRTGKPYLVIDVFTDERKKINAKIWDKKIADVNFKNYDVIDMLLEEGEYNGQPSYVIHDWTLVENADKSIFIPSLPAEKFEELKAYYLTSVESLKINKYKDLMKMFIDEYGERFWSHPAAKQMHGNYLGGLLEHTCFVHKVAMTIANNYNIETYKHFSLDLVSTGALLHDIGKLFGYDYSKGVIDHTRTEKTLGHTSIGLCIIYKYQYLLKQNFEGLMHIIASHMNQTEWGAISVPKTLEANIIATADLADARMNQYFDETIKWDENNKVWSNAVNSFIYRGMI